MLPKIPLSHLFHISFLVRFLLPDRGCRPTYSKRVTTKFLIERLSQKLEDVDQHVSRRFVNVFLDQHLSLRNLDSNIQKMMTVSLHYLSVESSRIPYQTPLERQKSRLTCSTRGFTKMDFLLAGVLRHIIPTIQQKQKGVQV